MHLLPPTSSTFNLLNHILFSSSAYFYFHSSPFQGTSTIKNLLKIMFSALMKSVVQGNTNRAFLAKDYNSPVDTLNPLSASTEILPREVPKHAATPATRKKRKAEEIDAGVVKASKKAKTEQPKQESGSEVLEIEQPADQSNPDIVIETVQSCSNDQQPVPRIIESRKNKNCQKKKETTPGFDRLRKGGLFYSTVPAQKSAEHTKPQVPQFPEEWAEPVDGAVDRKNTPDAQSVCQASSNRYGNVDGLAICPESSFSDQKPGIAADIATQSNVGDQSMSNEIIFSAKSKETAAATSSEIRSWVSSSPRKIPGPKDVGFCDKLRLPGTDTKLLPCHLMFVLDWKTYEPPSAADVGIIKAALATRKRKRSSATRKDSLPDKPKGVLSTVSEKTKAAKAKLDRITKKQPENKKQQGSDEKKMKR